MDENYKVITPENPEFKTERADAQAREGRGFGFPRTLLLVCLAALLGGSTLGGGIGAGLILANRRVPEQVETVFVSEPAAEYAFVESEITTLPISVKTKSFSEVIKSVSESVVSINVTSMYGGWQGMNREIEGSGSGFIFEIDDEKVYIATNCHVVENATSISVSLDDMESVKARVIGEDRQSDLAVISVEKAELDALGIPYSAVVFGDSDKTEVGDQVVAIGNSLGGGQTATYGIISAVNRKITVENLTLNVMQTDAAINMGNSGGPLVNSEGEVIGINTAKTFSTGAEGMGFCIPINDAVGILEQLRFEGSVKKPYIGILGPINIDEAAMGMYNLSSTGVLVTAVDEESGAGRAGLQQWDLIVGFNGGEINGLHDLLEAIKLFKPGETISLQINRGGNVSDFEVVLGEMPEQ